MEKKDVKNPMGCLLGAILLVVVIITLIKPPRQHFPASKATTNDTIIRVYSYVFKDKGVIMKRIAEIMSSIDYSGDMLYRFESSPGCCNKLHGRYGYLNDTFPWVAPEIERLCRDNFPKYDIYVRNNVVVIPYRTQVENRNNRVPYFIYTNRTEKSLMSSEYNGYLVCDTIDNGYPKGWLLRLEKCWYLVSPDSSWICRYY